MSAPVSTRKEILLYLSKTNMRRDARPSSFAAFTHSWSRFPGSRCVEEYTSSLVVGKSRGNNRVQVAVFLEKSTYDGFGFVHVKGDCYRGSTHLLAPAVGLSVHSRCCIRRSMVRLLPYFVQAAR